MEFVIGGDFGEFLDEIPAKFYLDETQD